MGNLLILIEDIERKVEVLIKKNTELQNKIDVLDKKLKSSDLIIDSQRDEMKFRLEELESLKLANSMLGNDEYKTKTKLKINSLIKEIDICIANLSMK